MRKNITVYTLVRHCLSDSEFNCGGISKNEEDYIKAIGLTAEDESELFKALYTVCCLNKKYSK